MGYEIVVSSTQFSTARHRQDKGSGEHKRHGLQGLQAETY